MKKEALGKTIFDELSEKARYALKSRSRDLVYETYGAAKMAYNLDAITKGEFYTLNDMLVRNGLNKPSSGIR